MIEHPELPFTIESDLAANRYIKRYPNGEVEAATATDYLLGLMLLKLDALKLPDFTTIEGVELEAVTPPFDEILERLTAIEASIKDWSDDEKPAAEKPAKAKSTHKGH